MLRSPGSRVRAGAALPPLLALLLSCGSGTKAVPDGGGPEAGAGAELSVTTTSLPDGTVDVKYHAALAAKGGWRPLSWLVSEGSLPSGLSMNPTTGAIDGSPTQEGQFALTVQATDSGIPQQSATAQLNLRIQPRPGPVAITTASLPAAQVGAEYSATLAASGGALPYAWSWSTAALSECGLPAPDAGAPTGLPSGLELDILTGAITGVPRTLGAPWSFCVRVRVNDSMSPSQTDSRVLGLTVNGPSPITITTASLPEGQLGHGYWGALRASGGLPPYAWQLVSGTLPAGLSFPFMANDGGVFAITGTPTALGTSTFTVRVFDSYQPSDQAQKQLSITVVTPPQEDAAVQEDAGVQEDAQQDAPVPDDALVQDDAPPDGPDDV